MGLLYTADSDLPGCDMPLAPSSWELLLNPGALASRSPPPRFPASPPLRPSPASSIAWTAEQQALFDSRSSRGCLTALAGSGKTHGMIEYMRRHPRLSWRYVVYNKAMERQVQPLLPPNVTASTLHGLAFPKFGAPLAHKLSQSYRVATRHSQQVTPWASTYEQVMLSAIKRFTASQSPGIAGFPASGEERAKMTLASRARMDWSRWSEDLERLWAAQIDPSHPQGCEHDTYVKLLQLSGSGVDSDGLVLDEAQDVTPCMHAWWQQQGDTCRWRAGDPYQSIYGWRGVAATDWPSPDETSLSWTISQRCPPQICALATTLLQRLGSPHAMASSKTSASGAEIVTASTDAPFDAHLARTRQGVIERALWLRQQGLDVRASDYGLWERLGLLEHAVSHRIPLAGTDIIPGSEDWETWTHEYQEQSWSTAWRLFRRWGSSWTEQHALWSRAMTGVSTRVMTIHEAKGATFGRVALHQDVPQPSDPSDEEVRLLYVAVTRASQIVGLPPGWALP